MLYGACCEQLINVQEVESEVGSHEFILGTGSL